MDALADAPDHPPEPMGRRRHRRRFERAVVFMIWAVFG